MDNGPRMDKQGLMDLLNELGIRPSRRLGQNFLIDPNLLEALVRSAGPQPDEDVLEIGPGPALLTVLLLDAGARVTAVEYDRRFAGWLRAKFAEVSAFHLVEADACNVDYASLFRHRPFRCIGNLPYRISSPLLANFARLENPPFAVHVLLQKETAERLAAAPDSRTYGALTVQIQALYTARLLRRVPPQVFWPAPRVESVFLELRERPDRPDADIRRAVADVARTAFSQRRKKALPLLCRRFGEGPVRQAFERFDLAVDARAEHLPVAAYISLARELKDKRESP